ncbi:MAG: 16S rRNA (adenine(1518)-N(6)/adenine(1519)-N(6))-dimethyltransferase RsmA [Chloroherpetonaceae bacterium]|nr:16S rRNA (adenine(1518)-N(6)/adenine(1519)-N(6))-dimethyltransferase RsmA [Chloroherpetonaceae bacterium]MCS7211614.1 16S rRNA (adenine(1518)-N(6)/adenine(1519)-N(6))-dimethyltransferase RsmA [Chloroherpetonaceae bacterium]
MPKVHYKGSAITPQKRLGQNFLVDDNLARKIVETAHLSRDDRVLEIGPGFGSLTKYLAERLPHFLAVEKDHTLAAFIRTHYAQVQLIEGDFLDVSLAALSPDKKLKVLGNIPYAITSPILFKLLDERAVIESATLMVQEEVARRLLAKPCTKAYGILAVQCQAFADLQYCFKVKRRAFKPMPNVDSAVVHFIMRPDTGIQNEAKFRQLVRAAFRMRRKTLENNLKDLFDLRYTTFNLKRRAEELSVAEFIQLSEEVEALTPPAQTTFAAKPEHQDD